MIRNNSITHGSIESDLNSWHLDSFLLNALLIATLTTVLSYQVTAIIFDLFLGLKPRGEAKASSLHTILLTDESSPLSVAAAIFRKDALDRARFHRDIPPTTAIAREDSPISKKAVLTLIILLITAPLVNLLSVILTLEYDKRITFEAASFGGLALSITKDNTSVSKSPFAGSCRRVRAQFSELGEDYAEFFDCLESKSRIQVLNNASESALTVRTTQFGVVHLIASYKDTVDTTPIQKAADMLSGHVVYRLNQDVDVEGAKRLIAETRSKIESTCHKVDPQELQRVERADFKVMKNSNLIDVSHPIKCLNLTLEEMLVMEALFDHMVTLSNTSIFQSTDVSQLPLLPTHTAAPPKWNDARNLTLMTRRRSYMSPAILCISVAVVLVARVLVEIFTNNDIYDALEDILVRSLNMKSPYYLLRNNDVQRYDFKYQFGNCCHYGVERHGLPTVARFYGGVVGSWKDEESIYKMNAQQSESDVDDVRNFSGDSANSFRF